MKGTVKQEIGKFVIPRLPMTKANFDILRFEINAILLNLNNRINPLRISRLSYIRKQKDLSVNIGAGPFGKQGWVNVDMYRMKNITLLYDCRRKLPFQNNTVRRIRCEHVFEHLDRRDEVPKFLRECLRTLQPGGALRIVVPDLQLFINAYVSGGNEQWRKLGFDLENLPWGLETPMDILNHTFRQNGEHKFGYDFYTLKRTLQEAGFEKIHKMTWGESVDEELTDDLVNHRPYSLYVDCVK